MLPRKQLLWLAAAIIVLPIAWYLGSNKNPQPAAPSTQPTTTSSRPAGSRESNTFPSDSAAAPAAVDPAVLADDVRAVTPEDRDSVERMALMIRDYRSQLSENPTGNNAEITAALLGGNRKQLHLEIPEGSSLNAAKELCDVWKVPYFFHQISGSEMEIRSAGPDKKIWTPDDIISR